MRFGVVGTNFVSDFFMKGASCVDEVEVTSVCSGTLELAQEFADKYGIKNVYPDYVSMINSGNIDAIYLAVPNRLHHDMAIDCLNRKMPTWCEKPLGGNYRQVKEMIDAAIKNDTYLHDGTVSMYSPNLPIVKEYLGKIGKIRRVVLMFGKYSSRYDAYLANENPTTFRNELYNGSLMDLGVYVLSDAIALFGKPQSIFSQATLLPTNTDCAGCMVFKYDGFDCIIMHSKVTDTNIVSEIQGEKGNIMIPQPSVIADVYYKPRIKDESLKYEANGMVQVGTKFDDHFANEMRDFIYSQKHGLKQSSLHPFNQILDIHEVLTECRLQAGIKFDCD